MPSMVEPAGAFATGYQWVCNRMFFVLVDTPNFSNTGPGGTFATWAVSLSAHPFGYGWLILDMVCSCRPAGLASSTKTVVRVLRTENPR